MSGMTMKYRASFRTARRNGAAEARPEPGSTAPEEAPSTPCRAARLLALAHYVERQIEAGVFRSQADAARRFGITQGRATQVQNLLLLAPEIQERLLTGDLRCGERRLRRAVVEPAWNDQKRRL